MNEQIHPNLFVFDRARTADGLLFVTGGDRCRYLGKSSREKPDWLKQNEGRYRRIEDVLREERSNDALCRGRDKSRCRTG